MKRTASLTFIFLTVFGFTQSGKDTAAVAMDELAKEEKENRVIRGEQLEFRLNYGWFTVGKADLIVDNSIRRYNDEDCYKIDIYGRTVGLIGLFARVDDTWGAYVGKDDLLPVLAYSDINEGKYTRKDQVTFDKKNRKITVEMVRKEKIKPIKYFDYENEMHELMSGYFQIRNIDFSQVNIGDTIRFNAFYANLFYNFGLVYQGIEEIKTKIGDVKAYKVIPILPENKIFPGANPITAWISSDQNQLPLKVEANMSFGTAECELISYKNLKYETNFN